MNRFVGISLWTLTALSLCRCANSGAPLNAELVAFQSHTTNALAQMAHALDANYSRYLHGQKIVISSTGSGTGSTSGNTASTPNGVTNVTPNTPQQAAEICLQAVTSIAPTATNWSLMANQLVGCLTQILSSTGGINTLTYNNLSATGQTYYLYTMQPTQTFTNATSSSSNLGNLVGLASGKGWEN